MCISSWFADKEGSSQQLASQREIDIMDKVFDSVALENSVDGSFGFLSGETLVTSTSRLVGRSWIGYNVRVT